MANSSLGRQTRRSTRLVDTERRDAPSPPATSKSGSRQQTKGRAASSALKKEQETPSPAASRKRKRPAIKSESSPDQADLPPSRTQHGIPSPPTEDEPPSSKKKRASPKKTPIKSEPTEMEKIAEKAGIISPVATATPGSAKKKGKKGNYGLSPGSSPYPTYDRPTAEECHEVVRILSKVHGQVSAPKEIRAPSLTTAGCGEVPSVLDALIRTRLSAATTGANSSRAFQGLVKAFGTITTGTGKGSVDWGAVRRASQQDVFEAIKCGGLAGSKSKDIKAILDLVWAENQERAAAIKDESKGDDDGGSSSSSSSKGPQGAEHEDAAEKRAEVSRADEGVPSLDHLHLLGNEAAFDKLVSYPGIGPKTASCVLLFCLRRPSFAVDTHVFRLCRYLAWVPPDAEAKREGWPRVDRNTTYAHCEVRVPDELKYPLHQLLIKHGKTCGRCRAATGMGSEGWSKGCPIEHLVKRHGAKKGGWEEEDDDEDGDEDGGVGRKRSKGKTAKRYRSDSESEEAEMTDLGSDEDEDVSDGGDPSRDED